MESSSNLFMRVFLFVFIVVLIAACSSDPPPGSMTQGQWWATQQAQQAMDDVVYVRDNRTEDLCYAWYMPTQSRGALTVVDCEKVNHLIFE